MKEYLPVITVALVALIGVMSISSPTGLIFFNEFVTVNGTLDAQSVQSIGTSSQYSQVNNLLAQEISFNNASGLDLNVASISPRNNIVGVPSRILVKGDMEVYGSVRSPSVYTQNISTQKVDARDIKAYGAVNAQTVYAQNISASQVDAGIIRGQIPALTGVTCPPGQFVVGFDPGMVMRCAPPSSAINSSPPKPSPTTHVFTLSSIADAKNAANGDAYCKLHGDLTCTHVEWIVKNGCPNGGSCPFSSVGNAGTATEFSSTCSVDDLRNQNYAGSAKRVFCFGTQSGAPFSNVDPNEVVLVRDTVLSGPPTRGSYNGFDYCRNSGLGTCVAVDWLYKASCANQGYCNRETPGAVYLHFSCEVGGINEPSFNGSIIRASCKRFK